LAPPSSDLSTEMVHPYLKAIFLTILKPIPLPPLLIELVQSGQYLQAQIQEAADICFDELGIDPPQQGGG